MVCHVALSWSATWHCGGAHLSDDLCQGGAHLLTWANGRVTHGKLGAEMASYCAAMCQLGSNSLLMWVTAAVLCGISLVRWPSVAVPCGISWDEVDHWLTATWH
jgi:hypothetical protein